MKCRYSILSQSPIGLQARLKLGCKFSLILMKFCWTNFFQKKKNYIYSSSFALCLHYTCLLSHEEKDIYIFFLYLNKINNYIKRKCGQEKRILILLFSIFFFFTFSRFLSLNFLHCIFSCKFIWKLNNFLPNICLIKKGNNI